MKKTTTLWILEMVPAATQEQQIQAHCDVGGKEMA